MSSNREAWLTSFAEELLPLIKKRTGLYVPSSNLKLSCGFPSKGGTRRKNRRIGECHHVGPAGQGQRKFHQLFIHPELIEPVAIGETVAHEILHAALPHGTGHRKPFSQAAKKLGLEGKPTSTYAGDELATALKGIAEQLGPYPHEALVGYGGPKQPTQMLKVMCPICGYILRTTAKWLDEVGPPDCPQCNVPMQEAGVGDEATDPLQPVNQVVEFKVRSEKEPRYIDYRGRSYCIKPPPTPFDPRWSIQMSRQGKRMQWYLVDFGLPIHLDTGRAVLGIPQPRLTPAESRSDAIALLEALREGTLTYKDIKTDDDDPALDVDDPFYEDEDEETGDFEDQELTEEEIVEYEREMQWREGS